MTAALSLLTSSFMPPSAENPTDQETETLLDSTAYSLADLPGPGEEGLVMAWEDVLPDTIKHRLRIALPERIRPLFPEEGDSLLIDPETLWLARCIYSESDRPHEQEVVAWVVRNRVATAYRGRTTYHDVVLDPYQFSAFNPGNARSQYYRSLMPDDRRPRWQRALQIAAYVRRTPWSERPFPVDVRHFYSEVSMKGQRHPTWSIGQTSVASKRFRTIDPYRFRFFALDEDPI